MAARKKNARSKKPRRSAPSRTRADRPKGRRPPTIRKEAAGVGTKRERAIDAYLAGVSPKNRALLNELRRTIHAIVPGAEECISYRLPAFRYEGKIIGGFSATAKGCSYYPFSGTTLNTVAADIEGYSQTKGALHFDAENPLPTTLVRKLLEARIAEGG